MACQQPNARLHLLPEAEAQRTLEAVRCKPLFGWECPTTLAWTFLCPLCRGLLFEDDSLREPLLNVLARYLTCRNCQKHGNNFLIRCTQFCPIQFQKDFCYRRGNAFVPVQECMGLCQMIGIRRGTGGESCLFVIRSVFHSRQRGFQCPDITHTMQSPKFFDGPRMDSEHFVCTEEKQGNLLYSGPCASWI
jgi:hypothetical protein